MIPLRRVPGTFQRLRGSRPDFDGDDGDVQVVQFDCDSPGDVDGELEALIWSWCNVEDVLGHGVHVQAVDCVAAHLEHDRLPSDSLSLLGRSYSRLKRGLRQTKAHTMRSVSWA